MRVRIARADHDAATDTWRFSFPYDEDLIDELKAEVPSSARVWVPSRRQWVIDDSHAQAVIDLLEQHGFTVQVQGSGPGGRQSSQNGAGATDGAGVYWQAQYDSERRLREQTQAALVAKTRELTAARGELASVRLELAAARRKGTAPGRGAGAPTGGNWAQGLKAALPADLQDRAFKALLRVLHPDVGGSTELTKDLTNVFRGGR